jgi:hypothetical protein
VSDKIELTRRQVTFIGGFVYGYFSDLEAPGFNPSRVTAEEIERAVSIALGALFPMREEAVEAELEAFISSL